MNCVGSSTPAVTDPVEFGILITLSCVHLRYLVCIYDIMF